MPSAAPDPLIGRQVRDLRIVDQIGRGGMGAVYRAQHVLLHETRAVKVIRKGAINVPDAVERFQREARLAVRLRHPNLVLVYDFFVEDGDYYLVMEHVPGESLGKRIRTAGPIDAKTACQLGVRCCAGLAYAHDLGIVHRDLSPENILLMPAGGGHEPKIIDFGIARAVTAPTEEDKTEVDQTLTRVGGFVGKPRYASPEQAGRLARGEQIDARSDLYTFGLVLYEMVTADLPFHSDSEIGYLPLHYSALPERPTALRPDLNIPLSLEHVILRCLEKDRGDRFQSARELAQALESVLRELASGQPAAPPRRAAAAAPARARAAQVTVHAPSAPGPSRAVLLVIAGLAMLVAALGSALFMRLRQEQPADAAPTLERAVIPAVPAPAPSPDIAEESPAPAAVEEPSASTPAIAESPVLSESVAPNAGAGAAPLPRAPGPSPAQAEPKPALASAIAAPQARAVAETAPPSSASVAPAVALQTPPAPKPPPLAPSPKAKAAPERQPRAPSVPPPLPAGGAERYLLVNLHPRGRQLSSVHQGIGLLPLCTKVRIDATAPNRVTFTVLETGARYSYDRWKRRLDLAAHLGRVLGTSCPLARVRALSPADQAGIAEGKIRLGMTKEGVSLAIGYPAEHATPSLDSDAWRYWTEATRTGTMQITFVDGLVSEMTPYR